jgi:ubiquitin carboxyl-terminal hydrolase 14
MDRGEKKSGMGMAMGYAQQGELLGALHTSSSTPQLTSNDIVDAEECYSAIVNSLRNVPGLDQNGRSVSTSAQAATGQKRFIEQYMMGVIRREMSCNEAPEEPHTVTEENVLKVECNITGATNFMAQGLLSVSRTGNLADAFLISS